VENRRNLAKAAPREALYQQAERRVGEVAETPDWLEFARECGYLSKEEYPTLWPT